MKPSSSSPRRSAPVGSFSPQSRTPTVDSTVRRRPSRPPPPRPSQHTPTRAHDAPPRPSFARWPTPRDPAATLPVIFVDGPRRTSPDEDTEDNVVTSPGASSPPTKPTLPRPALPQAAPPPMRRHHASAALANAPRLQRAPASWSGRSADQDTSVDEPAAYGAMQAVLERTQPLLPDVRPARGVARAEPPARVSSALPPAVAFPCEHVPIPSPPPSSVDRVSLPSLFASSLPPPTIMVPGAADDAPEDKPRSAPRPLLRWAFALLVVVVAVGAAVTFAVHNHRLCTPG